jgi:mannose-1-phosphate guanylyltransferase
MFFKDLIYGKEYEMYLGECSRIEKKRRGDFMAIHAVIMAGGRGERLWPFSKPDMPKQLHAFGTGMSLIRSTFERLSEITDSASIYVVTGADIAGRIREHLPELPPENILIEPVGRNTAPCVAYAALHISRKDPEAVMAVFPADHLVGNPGKFLQAITFGIKCLSRWPEFLITLGMVPDHPETGYGYIAPGETLGKSENLVLHRVLTFKEKPDEAYAREYIQKGYLWNAGMFIWRADTILEAFRKHLPIMYGQVTDMAAEGEITPGKVNEFYFAVEPVSIDYGILEKASEVAVIPAEFGWDDIGSWDALGKVLPRDDSGNTCQGEVVIEDAKGNVVWATSKKIALIGVNDLVIVEGDDAILVCPRNRSQDVSRLAKKMK